MERVPPTGETFGCHGCAPGEKVSLPVPSCLADGVPRGPLEIPHNRLISTANLHLLMYGVATPACHCGYRRVLGCYRASEQFAGCHDPRVADDIDPEDDAGHRGGHSTHPPYIDPFHLSRQSNETDEPAPNPGQ